MAKMFYSKVVPTENNQSSYILKMERQLWELTSKLRDSKRGRVVPYSEPRNKIAEICTFLKTQWMTWVYFGVGKQDSKSGRIMKN